MKTYLATNDIDLIKDSQYKVDRIKNMLETYVLEQDSMKIANKVISSICLDHKYAFILYTQDEGYRGRNMIDFAVLDKMILIEIN